MPTDQELVRQALSGHSRAAESLLRRYGPVLRREAETGARRLCDGSIDPDDVLQEFYLKVCRDGYRVLALWRGLTDMEQPGIEPYFKEILRNVLRDAGRRARVRRGREADADDIDLDELPGDSDCGEDEIAVEQRLAAVRECIESSLTEGLRDVIRLCIEGHSHAEIASMLGIEPGNVRVRLHRATEAIRRCLENNGRNAR
jgi:RNA polymerase sigma-70 factor (ECF subfamily)